MKKEFKPAIALLACICAFIFMGWPATALGAEDSEILVGELWQKVEKARLKRDFALLKNLLAQISKNFPDHPSAAKATALLEPNAFLAVEKTVDRGTRMNRINLVISGDGYSVSDQGKFRQNADLALKFFFQEEPLKTYQHFFNVDYLYMASKEERIPEGDVEADSAWRSKSAAEAGQVGVPLEHARRLVAKWIPDWGTLLVIAQGGKLGRGWLRADVCAMAPNAMVVAYHEFGHSFAGLLDEYRSQKSLVKVVDRDSEGKETGWHTELHDHPTSFTGTGIHGPNATSNPDRLKAPWSHWFSSGKSGVGFLEGALGHDQKAWRPTDHCLMNSVGGGGGFCPVCLEHFILVIHQRVKILDPSTETVTGDVIQVPQGGFLTLDVRGPAPFKGVFESEWTLAGVKALTLRGTSAPSKGVASYKLKIPHKDLPVGKHKLHLVVRDPSPYVKSDPKGLMHGERVWDVEVAEATGE